MLIFLIQSLKTLVPIKKWTYENIFLKNHIYYVYKVLIFRWSLPGFSTSGWHQIDAHSVDTAP
jgi:hypothetical protein